MVKSPILRNVLILLHVPNYIMLCKKIKIIFKLILTHFYTYWPTKLCILHQYHQQYYIFSDRAKLAFQANQFNVYVYKDLLIGRLQIIITNTARWNFSPTLQTRVLTAERDTHSRQSDRLPCSLFQPWPWSVDIFGRTKTTKNCQIFKALYTHETR